MRTVMEVTLELNVNMMVLAIKSGSPEAGKGETISDGL